MFTNSFPVSNPHNDIHQTQPFSTSNLYLSSFIWPRQRPIIAESSREDNGALTSTMVNDKLMNYKVQSSWILVAQWSYLKVPSPFTFLCSLRHLKKFLHLHHHYLLFCLQLCSSVYVLAFDSRSAKWTISLPDPCSSPSP